jgi:hypothetical protein
MADPTDLTPVARAEFARELTPCLELTAPAGMDADRKRVWFSAAYEALAGIPIGLLKRGAAAAMVKADHPSKIVPAIMREIGDSWDQRRKLAAPRPAPVALLPRVPASECKEVGALMADLAEKLRASDEA